MIIIEAVSIPLHWSNKTYRDIDNKQPLFENNEVLVSNDDIMVRLLIESNVTTIPILTSRIRNGEREIKVLSALTTSAITRLIQTINSYFNSFLSLELSDEQLYKLSLFRDILRKFTKISNQDEMLILNFNKEE